MLKVLNYLPSLTGSLSVMLSCEQKFLYAMAFRMCGIVRVAIILIVGLFTTPPLSRDARRVEFVWEIIIDV